MGRGSSQKMWVFKGAALLAVCAALAIDESDLKSGTAFELSNALLQEHKGESGEEWKNNHRCWCSTDGSKTDEEEKLSDERGKKKIIAKLERWNKEHRVAGQQKSAAALAKIEAQREAEKAAEAEAEAAREAKEADAAAKDEESRLDSENVGEDSEEPQGVSSCEAQCSYQMAELQLQLDQYNQVIKKLQREAATLALKRTAAE